MQNPSSGIQPLLSTLALAKLVGVTVDTVKHWRVAGRGPKFVRISRTIRYTPQDVAEWLEANRHESTEEGQ